MENNNNGRGVFYGVIGVATLIVAIIGATFAYFAAQTNTEDNAVRAEAAIIELDIATHSATNLGANMIPVEADGTTKSKVPGASDAATEYAGLFPRFPSAGSSDTNDAGREACEDLLGNRICSIYTFTVSNPSTASQQIFGFLTVKNNTFGNLKYAVFKGTPTEIGATTDKWKVLDSDKVAGYTPVDGNYNVAAGGIVKAMADVPKTATSNPGDFNATSETDNRYIPAMTVTLAADDKQTGGNDEVTYTVLLWIEETGENQTEADSSEDGTTAKSFEGGIFINTGGESGVTATLKLAG